MPHLAPHQRFENWWFVDARGIPRTLGDGGIALLEHMALTRPLGRALRRAGLTRLMTQLDHLVSRLRNRLNRVVPAMEPPIRFP